jgi:hypothetical protein
MNLENLNLVELNAQEVKEITGGFHIGLRFLGIEIIGYDSNDGWTTDLW